MKALFGGLLCLTECFAAIKIKKNVRQINRWEVCKMTEKISRTLQKILFGVSSLRLNKTRERKRYTLNRKFLTAEERWYEIGARLRESACKVVEQNERR